MTGAHLVTTRREKRAARIAGQAMQKCLLKDAGVNHE